MNVTLFDKHEISLLFNITYINLLFTVLLSA
ncbi:hypothetical protein PPBDW_II0335 [Photobacterium kishitanii]|nr:hypothetical protein PPBDW_II0335 [Photobacterium kishitanii]